MSYPISYEVRDGKVIMVCRVGEVTAELVMPDELVAAWMDDKPRFCPDCGSRLAHVGDGPPWCSECPWADPELPRLPPAEDDGTFWG